MELRLALLVTTGDRYVSMAVNFISLAVVARLMAPEDFGVAVLGAAITSVAVAAREFASQTWLIQRQELSTPTVRSFFTVMVLVTLLIVGGIYGAADWIEQIYDREGITFYLHLICLALLIEPISQTIGGLLRRELAFGKVAILNITNAMVYGFVIVELVALGMTFEAFGWAWLASASTTSVVAVFLRRDLRIFVPLGAGLLEPLRFGAYNGSSALLHRTFEALPLLAVGHILNVAATGMFQRVLTVAQLPDRMLLSGVISVALPAFAREARKGGNLRQAYLRAIEYIAAFQWPALALLAVLADPIILMLFGSQWTDVADLLPIAAVAWMFFFTAEINYPVLVVCGAIRANLIRAAIIYPASGALIIAAAGWGLEAAVWSLLIVGPFQCVVSMLFVRRVVAFSAWDLLAHAWRGMVLALAASIGPLLLTQIGFLGLTNPVVQLLLAAPLAGIGWLLAILATAHPLRGSLSGVPGARSNTLVAYLLRISSKRRIRSSTAP
ncbi:oligosaccharide flippase family protein [Roseomonas sp. HF4]|uniref:oligosaccharide flippase family protein n=1 Tax=Roseomonas sp. HF4 TaxID=2562313 RepID=UPI0010C0A2E9|nr:oligosaccharide flippase family protein [Roseomonas sp. HF4]